MLRMYRILVAASFRSRMQHPFNFIVGALMAAFVNAVEFALIAVVLKRFGSVQGWSLYEVTYLYGVILLCKTLYRTVASDVHQLEKYLVSGDLDQLLTRPVPVLLALMAQNVTIYAAEFLQGAAMLAVSLGALRRPISAVAVPQMAALRALHSHSRRLCQLHSGAVRAARRTGRMGAGGDGLVRGGLPGAVAALVAVRPEPVSERGKLTAWAAPAAGAESLRHGNDW
jgi:hypothetical protein